MRTVTIEGTDVVIRLSGWSRVLAMRREVRVPLGTIKSVTLAPDRSLLGWSSRIGARLPGTFLPNKYVAGSFLNREGWTFASVGNPDKTIGIETSDRRYRRLIVEVDDPETTAAMIRRVAGLAEPE